MRPFGFLLATLAIVPRALGKSVIVYFDDKDTPDSVVNKAKADIVAKGGKITHVYSIIKGFAADAPEEALQTVSAWGKDHSMRIEEDKVVSFNG